MLSRPLQTLLIFSLLSIAALGCGPSSSASNSPGTGQCAAGLSRCGNTCVDLSTDADHCGMCGNPCGDGQTCSDSACTDAPSASCDPGDIQFCYSGPDGTEGLGLCQAGQRTCGPGGSWSACLGEVVPISEVCGNNVDDDCNGLTDDEVDADGDGWTNCGGDCCDVAGVGCGTPELVNPGAFEVTGNMVDDDCDSMVDNALALCDTGLASDTAEPMHFANAIDLCRTAIEDAPPEQRTWGVISARLTLLDGSSAPNPSSRAIRPDFGATTTRSGDTMAVLSTGRAADRTDTSPSFGDFQRGQRMGRSSQVPSDWLSANGGTMPNAPGCPDPDNSPANVGRDPVMLTLRVRVPTNARSFSIATNFMSSEYPEWVCSPFNDFFVVLLDSTFAGDPANPADKNLARYTAPDGQVYPVGVNLAYGDTGLFRVCKNGATGCGPNAVAGTTSTCTGQEDLAGTGFEIANPQPYQDEPGVCGSNNLVGGGTGWLVTSGNVVPGEIIELRIAIWDTSDDIYDSLVLIDNFQWSVEASEPGTDIVVE